MQKSDKVLIMISMREQKTLKNFNIKKFCKLSEKYYRSDDDHDVRCEYSLCKLKLSDLSQYDHSNERKYPNLLIDSCT